MTNLISFHFESQVLRVLDVDGESWFVARDVAQMLGYTNPSKAVADHVDEEDVTKRYIPTESNNYLLINESGLYALIFGSRLSGAKKFKRWVTAEVLPQIRKTGGYQMDPDTIAIPKDEYIALLKAQVETLKAQATLRPGPRAWTPEEDQRLIDLRRQGLGFTRIGYRLGRSKDACQKRWQRLSLRHATALEQQGELFAQRGAA